MKTTLKMAERKRALKVSGFHESLGGFGKKLLAGMGLEKGAKLEIEPAYVSQIVLQFGGKEIQLGYESLMSVVVGDRRLTELTPGELGTISALEVGRGELAKFLALGLEVGTIVDVKKFIPGPGPLFVEVQGAQERGKLSFRCEGRNSSGRPTRMRVPMRSTVTDRPVLVMKAL